jgi:hypothetical protein
MMTTYSVTVFPSIKPFGVSQTYEVKLHYFPDNNLQIDCQQFGSLDVACEPDDSRAMCKYFEHWGFQVQDIQLKTLDKPKILNLRPVTIPLGDIEYTADGFEIVVDNDGIQIKGGKRIEKLWDGRVSYHPKDDWLIELANRQHDEIEVLKKAVGLLYAGTIQGHADHWDNEGTHGANCPACKFAQIQREAAAKLLGYIPDLIYSEEL